MNEHPLLWIPVFPLLGAVANLLFGTLFQRALGERIGKELVHLVALLGVAFSCFFTFLLVFQQLAHAPTGQLVDTVYTWIGSGGLEVELSFVLDHLSGVMCMVVTGVGLLIHIFSVGYMIKDPGYHRYFAYLNLFMAAMLILVLADSLPLMFVGWEGVGLCSYLLIGFWFTDDAKATAGRKAFIVNRIGDFGFIIGMLLIYWSIGSLEFSAIEAAARSGENSIFVTTAVFGVPLATVATMFLFLGCTGKSAQIPLYTWLPDAMAGPTPVSALIHAATMVTAGVYLIVRLNFLFALAPLTMGVIAVIGATTALFAATIGITQNDIKKVLAYSTVSQLGYMFLAAGMGAWTAAIFHLVTHAFFKACLFLGSGAVIEACHHEQDIRNMGGLRQKMPVTAATFFVSCLAIAGIPIFAGFFSKDEILLAAYTHASVWSPGINWYCYGVGLLAAFCTAFYMFRLYFLTFEGDYRGDEHTWTHYVQEYAIMSFPLLVLAVGATIGGFLNYPEHVPGGHEIGGILHHWLEPITAASATFDGEYYTGLRSDPWAVDAGQPLWFQSSEPTGRPVVDMVAELAFMGVSVGVAAAGIAFATALYRRGPSHSAKQWAARLAPFYQASFHKYWIDELYDAVIVKPVRFIAKICHKVIDELVVDGLGVGGTSGTVTFFGDIVRGWHNGNVRRYIVILLLGTGIVFGSIYLNPLISTFGPTKVNPVDMGGLYPELSGPRAERTRKLFGWITIYENGEWTFRFGDPDEPVPEPPIVDDQGGPS